MANQNKRDHKRDNISGWFLLDKRAGEQSTRITSQVRTLFNARKAGHGGTLDPFAEGLLPIAMGEATKTMSFILNNNKQYRFTIRFGIATDSNDCEGKITEQNQIYPSQEQILQALPHFIGEIQQIPPRFSAVKVDGQRAYDLARSGESFELQARGVHIHDLQFLHKDDETSVTLSMLCSKGTYVRSFAVDLAKQLGTIGHLSYLRRTAVGHFLEKDAISLETAREKVDKQSMLLPIEAGLGGISVIALAAAEEAILKSGYRVSLLKRGNLEALAQYQNEQLLLARTDDRVIALVKYNQGELLPQRIFKI